MPGHICGPKIYRFQGWTFEVSPVSGPWPLTNLGDPRQRAGRKFWKAYEQFQQLPATEQQLHRIGGGCQHF